MTRRAICLVFAAALATASAARAAALPDRFDLVCQGVSTDAGGHKRSDARWYRFDLVRNSWCRDICRSAAQIEGLTPVAITLASAKPGDPYAHNHAISRLDASYTESLVAVGFRLGETAAGSCKISPFSGLPPTRGRAASG